MTPKANPSSDAWAQRPADRTSQTDDARIKDITVLPPPEHLIRFFPIKGTPVESLITHTRKAIHNIMAGKDDRLLVVVGPCSIHDPAAALDYARRLKPLRDRYADTLEIVMRVYFEKPRTTVGWKGLINDPHMDDTFDIDQGLQVARSLLLELAELGLPAGTEALDPIIPQYIADLMTWTAIGARTTESQTHREIASGLSTPVGFKNATNGSLDVAINALQSAARPHSFLGINPQGQSAVIRTLGNHYGHVVLRGGDRPNYDSVSIALCEKAILEGNQSIVGLMVESNLGWGNQSIPADLSQLKYGVSVTDACVDWATTETMLREAHAKLKTVLPGRRTA